MRKAFEMKKIKLKIIPKITKIGFVLDEPSGNIAVVIITDICETLYDLIERKWVIPVETCKVEKSVIDLDGLMCKILKMYNCKSVEDLELYVANAIKFLND